MTSTDDEPKQLDRELSDQLKQFGFDPGTPVYPVDKIDFDLARIKQALFESTYRQPTTLPFYIGSRDPAVRSDPSWELDMVVQLVQAHYPPRVVRPGTESFGCFDIPQWYLRGFVYKSGFDTYPEIVRMHVHITTDSSADKFDGATVQVVRHPSNANPSDHLAYGWVE